MALEFSCVICGEPTNPKKIRRIFPVVAYCDECMFKRGVTILHVQHFRGEKPVVLGVV